MQVSEALVIVFVKLQFDNGVGWHIATLAQLPNAPEILTRFILVSRIEPQLT